MRHQKHLHLPRCFALVAHSETSSWARPSVNTMEIRGTFAENGLAPSVSVKLLSDICLSASPVMEPRPMYFICDTAFFMSLAELNCLNVNSVRTSVEYWSKPTRAALGEISSVSKIPETNCFTISKLSSPRLFDPSITNTRSIGPSVHPVKWAAECSDQEESPWSWERDPDSLAKTQRSSEVPCSWLILLCQCVWRCCVQSVSKAKSGPMTENLTKL